MTRFAPSFEIAGRRVGGGARAYVVAEAGANHDRDIDVAHALVDAAADAGVDAIKFQTYSGSALYSSRTPSFDYLGEDDRPLPEILDSLALPREWQAELAGHARARGIAFFSTPFDRDAVDELRDLGVPALKIASFEIVDVGLIGYAAAAGVPMILSTGMATYGEIESALGAVEAAGNREVALLRCASLYPSPPEIMNLRAMRTMRTAFGTPVGLSDHTLGLAVPTAAAALGAEMLEKHFTLSRARSGPDHSFALEPDELAAMVAAVREAEAALGHGRVEGPSELEKAEMYGKARRSVIAATAITAGTVIEADMLTVKRPGHGVRPADMELLIGRRARVDIEPDDVITWDMV